MEDLTGQTLKGYELLERIGAGGYGAVYRALQPAVGREVALKIIHPEVAGQPEFIRRFELEAQLIARLEHLHIVPLYDFWRDPTGAYLAMRWLRGGSLRRALEGGPLDLPVAARLLEQIASALTAAHNRRVVHRDVKPANILLDEDGNAYLADFGIAADLKNVLEGVGAGGKPEGTLDYLSPEQARGETVTSQTDQYSLGVTLYETLTGRHPFKAVSSVERLYKHINDPLPRLDGLEAVVTKALDEVIQTATAKDPGKRYPDVLQMAAAFREAAQIGGDGSPEPVEETLTLREGEILAHIVDGRSNKQIAKELFIELPTVKWHITQLYRKLGVRSRAQAVVRARELELLSSGQEHDQTDRAISGPINAALSEPVNPYKGLRPFEAADSRDFFGREALVEKLLARLAADGVHARFVSVVGPSGSGKSSLVGAGLVPAIWAGKLPGSERWFVVEMSPGARPLDALEVALTRIAADQAGNLNAHLQRDEHGLARSGALILPSDGSELLLVIDAFEELWVHTADEAVRNQFLDLLHAAVTDPGSRVRVVVSLRADFYDRPLQHPSVGELVRGGMETLLPLSAEELELAITRPAAQVGVMFEPGLPASIIEEMLYQPGALPLLQYALTELFEAREGRTLTRAAYQEIGGGVGALANKAEEIYQEFDPAGREAARQLFLRLVSLADEAADGDRATDTRRRVARADLLALADNPDVMDEVIDTFGAYRMLSLDHDPGTRQPIVELAHEALIGEWSRLGGWLEESREDLIQSRRLSALAGEWYEAGRDTGFLLRESRLDQLAGWAGGTEIALTADEQAYLNESLAARKSRVEDEQARQRRELETAQKLAAAETLRAEEGARANRRLRWLAAGLAVFLVVAVGAAWLALGESRRAGEQARLATARELAAESVRNLASDPELSLHLALEAVQTTYEVDGTVLPVAEEALHRAVQASRIEFTLPQGGGLAYSSEGGQLVVGGSDGSIGVWDARTGELVQTLEGHVEPVTSVAFSQDGRLLASASTDQQRIVWDFATGQQLVSLPGGGDPNNPSGLNAVAFSPDGAYLLSTAQFEEAGIWDIATGREIVQFDESAGPTGAFSPDGQHVALMTAVWDVSSLLHDGTAGSASAAEGTAIVRWSDRQFDFADAFIEFRAGSSELESAFQEPGGVSYSPDGARLLTAVVSSVAVIRDAGTGEPLFTLDGHTGVVNGVAFGPEGRMVATAGADGTARIWDAETGENILVLEGHQGEVVRVAFSPDGSSIATGGLDGTTKVWDISPGARGERPISNVLRGPATLTFDPAQPRLAMISSDGALHAVDIETGRPVYTVEAAPNSSFFYSASSPDGGTLAQIGENGAVHLYLARDGRRLRTLEPGQAASALAYHPDGDLLAVGSRDGTLSFVDLESGQTLGEWAIHDGLVNGLAFDGDGSRLAVSSADGDPLVLAVEPLMSGRPDGQLPAQAVLAIMTGHTDVVLDVELSPDSSALLTASWDGTARLWDAATGGLLHNLAGHQGRVWRAAFTPDGERIATAGADGAVILWSAESGERLLTLGRLDDAVISLAISADGRFLAAAGADGSLRIYVLPIEELMEVAGARLTRALTIEECRRYLHVDQCP